MRSQGITLLRLDNNDLQGEIPSEIADLRLLKELELQNNRLCGSSPQSLITLQRLDDLNFLDNAGLCAPANEDFQEWLKTVYEKGPDCDDETEE